MIIPLSLNEKEAEQFKRFANFQNKTVKEMVVSVVLEKIQDEYDWKTYKEALADYQIGNKTFSLSQVKREMGVR